MRAMWCFFGSLLFVGAASGSAVAATILGDPAITAPVAAFVRGFNGAWQGGPTAFPARVFSEDVAIIDIFPPFRWIGLAQAATWYATIMPKHGHWAAAHENVRLGTPFISIVDQKRLSSTGGGDLAYVVYPSVLTYMSGKKPMEIDGQWTFTLKKYGKRQWRITAHSWATTRESPPGRIQYQIKP